MVTICLCLETESRYKNKLTTESCFHLHKILDSVILSLLSDKTFQAINNLLIYIKGTKKGHLKSLFETAFR